MAPFDRRRLSRFKKIPTLLILKQIKFAKQKRKRKCWVQKIYLDCPQKEE